jgi:hypothetical protein
VPKRGNTKSSRGGDAPPTKRKKRQSVVFSEDEEDTFEETAAVISDEDGDDFEPESQVRKGAASSAAPRQGKAILSTKATKRKGMKEKDDKPILMKDESKASLATTSKSEDSNSALSINVPANVLENAAADAPVSSEGDAALAAGVPQDEPSKLAVIVPPPVPAKRKLPTIKKNKVPAVSASGGSGTSTPTSTKAPPLPSSSTSASGKDTFTTSGLSAGPGLRDRRPANTVGNKDLDLSNSAVYAELFAKTGGASRTGTNARQKEDERRKELDRMRDEARARREEELVSGLYYNIHGVYCPL